MYLLALGGVMLGIIGSCRARQASSSFAFGPPGFLYTNKKEGGGGIAQHKARRFALRWNIGIDIAGSII